MDRHLLILFLHLRGLAAALAHVGPHCVTGIALSPVDATSFLLSSLWPLRESTRDEFAGVPQDTVTIFSDTVLYSFSYLARMKHIAILNIRRKMCNVITTAARG
jgi:hypothetical protein